VTSDDLEARGRERCEADAQYNAALTALDKAVVSISRLASVGPEHRELVGTALMQFLQQITGFVETKDRELAAIATTRIDQIAREVQALGELHTHISVLQRATEMLKRSAATGPAPASPERSEAVSPQTPASASTLDDYKYVGFEDAFRGTDAVIEERLRAYVPLFRERKQVLDVGCGRGEMLAALKAVGIGASGIDLNADMVAVARERGLEAAPADALDYLSSLPDESLDGLIATQVLEHLEPSYLMRLLDSAARKLQPGSPIVLETINPACWLAFFSSYIRDFTHVRPLHPDTLQYLLRASGFERVDIQYSAPVPDHVKMKAVDLPAEVLASSEPASKAMVQIAHTINANAAILNSLLFTYLDYAAIGYRS
jgi:O-antigen chain-terminating methyltransferase